MRPFVVAAALLAAVPVVPSEGNAVPVRIPRPKITTTSPQPQWTTLWADSFDAGGVPSHWGLYDTQYGSTPNNWAAAANVTVSGGSMRMLMDYKASGNGGAGWYTAGMMDLTSGAAVRQMRVTVTWRLTGTDLTNVRPHRNMPILWSSDDPWYEGETDCFEGSSLTGANSFLHHTDDVTVETSPTYSVDVTQWHTYRFQLYGTTFTSWIDDLSTPVWVYAGTTATVPNVRRRVVLQAECRTGGCPSSTFSAETATIEVDSVVMEVPA